MPASVVGFVLTERAAVQRKERITRRASDRMGLISDWRRPMFVGTIHGNCFRQVQDYVPESGTF